MYVVWQWQQWKEIGGVCLILCCFFIIHIRIYPLSHTFAYKINKLNSIFYERNVIMWEDPCRKISEWRDLLDVFMVFPFEFCTRTIYPVLFYEFFLWKKTPEIYIKKNVFLLEGVRPKHTINVCLHRRRFYLCTYHINFISTVIKELYYTNDHLNPANGAAQRNIYAFEFEYLRMKIYTHFYW